MTPCDCCPLAAPPPPSRAEALAAEAAFKRSRDIETTAARIRSNLSWGKHGPPWARGPEAALADRQRDAAALEAKWGKDALTELRTAINAGKKGATG